MSDAKLQNDKDDKYSLRGRVFNHIREGILSGRYEENEELTIWGHFLETCT